MTRVLLGHPRPGAAHPGRADPPNRTWLCPACPLEGRAPKLLFIGRLPSGARVELRCPRCREYIVFSGQ